MTEKQENILNAALRLFAEEGYKPTSTSKVAKEAGVSEGLIFRHFKNKEGLLDAIVQMGEEKVKALFGDIVLETDPKQVILKTLNMSNNLIDNQDQIDFWKLQYKLKWELEIYGEHKMEPLLNALTNAFEKLGYQEPKQEAINLTVWMDGVATRYFLEKSFDVVPLVDLMKSKYKL